MAEYDLVCDVCAKPLLPDDGVVSWSRAGDSEHGFTLSHSGCVPRSATARDEVRRLVWPNEYLRFVSDRFGARIADPEPLRAIVWALAPFVMRHDNPAEMDGMRAASFGARPGVKPGVDHATPHDRRITERPGAATEDHAGK
ncbi:MAG TPA: hypothetical protein VFM93_13990 [Candidatus Limnocylindria bacterium]|nr:hypothetical protein [Candidatus Limnocylindria bacterium]